MWFSYTTAFQTHLEINTSFQFVQHCFLLFGATPGLEPTNRSPKEKHKSFLYYGDSDLFLALAFSIRASHHFWYFSSLVFFPTSYLMGLVCFSFPRGYEHAGETIRFSKESMTSGVKGPKIGSNSNISDCLILNKLYKFTES